MLKTQFVSIKLIEKFKRPFNSLNRDPVSEVTDRSKFSCIKLHFKVDKSLKLTFLKKIKAPKLDKIM